VSPLERIVFGWPSASGNNGGTCKRSVAFIGPVIVVVVGGGGGHTVS